MALKIETPYLFFSRSIVFSTNVFFGLIIFFMYFIVNFLGYFRTKLCVAVPCRHQEIEPDDDKLSLERVLLQIL